MKTNTVLTVFLVGVLWVGSVQASTGILLYPNTMESVKEAFCPGEMHAPAPSAFKEYDFSNLSQGQYTEFSGYDARGNAFTYRVTRNGSGVDVAVNSQSLQKIDRNTTVVFKGPQGVVKTVNLGQVANQRCGWLCVLAHICCIKIHVGPPGNTWEWDCDCINNEE